MSLKRPFIRLQGLATNKNLQIVWLSNLLQHTAGSTLRLLCLTDTCANVKRTRRLPGPKQVQRTKKRRSAVLRSCANTSSKQLILTRRNATPTAWYTLQCKWWKLSSPPCQHEDTLKYQQHIVCKGKRVELLFSTQKHALQGISIHRTMAISLPCCLNVGGALPLQLLLRLAVHIGNLPGPSTSRRTAQPFPRISSKSCGEA